MADGHGQNIHLTKRGEIARLPNYTLKGHNDSLEETSRKDTLESKDFNKYMNY